MSKVDNSIIRVGIDLGTTNSEIATSLSGTVEIIKNEFGFEYTPSVFGVDRAGNKILGKRAYDKINNAKTNEDIKNVKQEVKRLMGDSVEESGVHFSYIKKTFSPEEISSEILKSLKEDVFRKYPEADLSSVVITVPAYFNIQQNEATKRAGQMAGFDYVVLLQEPIAAAVSYGFDVNKNENWLVYDLGGGTFDVALISSNDGVLKVIEHDGDNHLGGKDIDSAIVDKVLKPALVNEFELDNFEKSNPDYEIAFVKLKAIAENAKISLSKNENTLIEIDGLGEDKNGKDIYVSFSYTQEELNKLIDPIVDKTLELAKNVIERSKIAKKSISKVVLVGGPTQIPYIRERIEKVLGIAVDSSVDPLTTVARGACIYGMSERVPEEVLNKNREKASKDEIKITLNYDPMTSELDQMVTGKVDVPDDGEYYIKISSDDGFYNSANIKIKNGTFHDNISIKEGQSNTYWIYLLDNNGNQLPIYPDSFTITHGLTVEGAPLTHTVGLIYSEKNFDNDFKFAEKCDPYFTRNSILPLEKTKTYKTIRGIKKGESEPLPIKVYEGEYKDPGSNDIVTTLEINGDTLPHDLPANTDIDITISINESREISINAYIPSVDMDFDVKADFNAQEVNTKELEKEFEVQKERAERMKHEVSSEESDKIAEKIDTIERDMDAGDSDSNKKADKEIRDLKQELDEFEQSRDIEQIESSFYELLDKAKKAVEENTEGNDELRERLEETIDTVEGEGREAIKTGDKVKLVQCNERLSSIPVVTLTENPQFWVYMLHHLEEQMDSFSNRQEALYHINRGKTAITENDLAELRRQCQILLQMLPKEKQDISSINGLSGITK